MTSRVLHSFILAGTIALSASIPGIASAVPADDVQPAAKERVTVRVVNNNWSDMRVYVVQGRSRLVRLGTVTSFTTSKFQTPRWFNPDADQLRLVVRGIGGEANATAPILVQGGDVVEVRIENNISTSNIRVLPQNS